MKKRVLALLLTATMILGLTACGGKDTPAADGGQIVHRRLQSLAQRMKMLPVQKQQAARRSFPFR